MVKLFVPQQRTVRESAGISTGASTRAGLAQADTGREISRLGKNYFDKATRTAGQVISFVNALSGATEAYTAASKARQEQEKGEDGKALYESLVEDVSSIGDEIKLRVSEDIDDPVVKKKFNTEFEAFKTNEKMTAFSTARKQQAKFGKESLVEGLSKMQSGAVTTNPDQISFYEQQAEGMLAEAEDAGLITVDEQAAMAQEFKRGVRVESYRNLILDDADNAASILSGGSEASLGLSTIDRRNLVKEAKAKVRDNKVEERKSVERLYRISKKDGIQRELLLRKEIERGVAGEMELQEAREDLGEEAYRDLTKTLKRATTAKIKHDAKMTAITDSIDRGDDLRAFNSTDIDDHFEESVRAQADGSEDPDKPVSMVERAAIAETYGKKVSTFSKQVNSSVLTGSEESAEDAVSAYLATRDSKSKALDGNHFTKDAEAVAEYSEMLVERAGMSPEDSIVLARKKVLEADDPVRKLRTASFRKLEDFKLKNLEETINSELGLENFIGVNKKINSDAMVTYKELVKESYTRTGDAEAAKKIAAAQMSKTHGLSTFNGIEEYTFAPPELMYPSMDVEDMRSQLAKDVSNLLPKGVGSPTIASDDMTRGHFISIQAADGSTNKVELISYAVTYEKDLGGGITTTLPLLSESTGEAVRWFPTATEVTMTASQRKIAAAKARRERDPSILDRLKDLL